MNVLWYHLKSSLSFLTTSTWQTAGVANIPRPGEGGKDRRDFLDVGSSRDAPKAVFQPKSVVSLKIQFLGFREKM